MSEMGRPRPEEYQPTLTWWSHAWRVLIMVTIGLVVWFTISERPPGMWVVDLVLGSAAFVLVFYRRRWPLAVAVTTTALATFSAVAAGPAVLAAVSLATRRRWGQVVGLGVLSLLSGEVFARINPPDEVQPWWLTLGTNVAVIAAMLAWGMYLGSRRELLWTLRVRAERAEAERDLRAQQSRLEERSRIAREMHDVLAHRISQISMHAGALSYRDDLTTGELREGAGVIREASHQALTDLRGVLGVLRDGSDRATNAPQPTYADLAELIAEARSSGVRVTYAECVSPEAAVPEAAGRTLYRIVQEGITNVRKHAPGAELAIDLAGSPDDGLHITLRNPLGFGPTTTPGAGLGLTGLTERALLRGGTLEHGRDGSDFVLEGWIPWAA